jgi:Protein of unknown function (DUF3040)
MALSMDEQRMLAEIERRLVAEDPGLASCLATFRRPGPATMLRSPRARIIGSLFTVLLVAMVSLVVYAMVPFRAHIPRLAPPTAGAPGNTAISSATHTRSKAPSTPQAAMTATTGVKSGASPSTRPAARPARSVTAQAQGGKAKSALVSASPAAKP